MKKVYCYVDESGQDTEGELFIVAMVIAGEERGLLTSQAEDLEIKTGKGFSKWHKTALDKRILYITAILSSPFFTQNLFYAHYKNSIQYLDMWTQSVAIALHTKYQRNYQATVIVDGLRDKEIPRFAKQLRARNVKLRKVRGAKDQSDTLIRLADALAGFARDSLENQPYTIKLRGLLQTVQRLKE